MATAKRISIGTDAAAMSPVSTTTAYRRGSAASSATATKWRSARPRQAKPDPAFDRRVLSSASFRGQPSAGQSRACRHFLGKLSKCLLRLFLPALDLSPEIHRGQPSRLPGMIGPNTQGQVTTTKAAARLVEQAKRVTLPLTHIAGCLPAADCGAIAQTAHPRQPPGRKPSRICDGLEPMLCCRLAASSRLAHPSPGALRLA